MSQFIIALVLFGTTFAYAEDQCGPTSMYAGKTELPNGNVIFEKPRIGLGGGGTLYFNSNVSDSLLDNVCIYYFGMKRTLSSSSTIDLTAKVVNVWSSNEMTISEDGHNYIDVLICASK